MALTQEDLQSIQNLMFGMEDRLVARMDEQNQNLEDRLVARMDEQNRNLEDRLITRMDEQNQKLRDDLTTRMDEQNQKLRDDLIARMDIKGRELENSILEEVDRVQEISTKHYNRLDMKIDNLTKVVNGIQMETGTIQLLVENVSDLQERVGKLEKIVYHTA